MGVTLSLFEAIPLSQPGARELCNRTVIGVVPMENTNSLVLIHGAHSPL